MSEIQIGNGLRRVAALAVLLAALVVGFLGLTGEAEAGITAGSGLAPAAGKIEQRVLKDTSGSSRTDVMVLLTRQADVSSATAMRDQDARGWYVYNTLKQYADRSQADLVAFLKQRELHFETFWVANVVAVKDVDRATVNEIAARADVGHIESNASFKGIDDPAADSTASEGPAPLTVEWGVQRVNAPQVWAMGYTGQGMVIANQDTGMRWTHTALLPHYRGWNGSTANHNYNWWDAIHSGGGGCGANSQQPCDDSGHGTHTTGTTSGDDGAGNQVGVAPGAKWIGCRNMDQGIGQPSTYTECFQFFIAPTDLNGQNPNPALRPDVMNNSWGCPTSEGCAALTLQTIVDNTQAAGIFVEASAGNSGSGCSSVTDPPALYASAFSTGAIDSSNTLAGFSSRGPVTVDGSGRMKPNISAPGVSVRSSYYSSDTSYASLSGTSMAGPHVVGVVALLWSARPELVRDIATTKLILQQSANPNVVVSPVQTCGGIPSSQIPNNSFGYGRVDALAAVNYVVNTPTATPTGTPPTATSTPTPTRTPCGNGANYQFATGTDTLVPGTTDTGNHCDDCVTSVTLPFAYSLYGTSYGTVNVSSNGALLFTGSESPYSNDCLPSGQYSGPVILGYWDDLYTTDTANGEGIFTSVSGSAPNRVFNIEWRAVPCCSGGAPNTDFEIRLYEGLNQFDIVYGNTLSQGSSATVGVQSAGGLQNAQYSCNVAGLTAGLRLRFTQPPCVTPTTVPTFTPTVTATSTQTPNAGPVVHGHVTLQGRPAPPDPRWSIPLTVTLRPSGGAAVDYPVTTDQNGYFTLALGTAPGSYSWRVKDQQTLANSGVAYLNPGQNEVDMGTLREGDGNNDNCVTIADMALLRLAFGAGIGDPNYNPNVDFNGDGLVNTSDFLLLRNNFGLCGAGPVGPR